MTTQKKIDVVRDLTDKLARAKSIILADYRGITHKQLEDLKRAVKKTGSDFIIVKNTLLTKALAAFSPEFKKEDLDKKLVGPTAALLAYEDEVSPLRELYKVMKLLSLPKIKFGYLGNQELNEEDITKLVKLPGKNVLIAQFVGQLKAPLYGLHRALGWNIQKFVFVLEAVKTAK